MPERETFGGEIKRVTIPDSGMPGWIETLHQSGLDQEAMDWFLARMNSTYAKAKGIPDVEGALADIEEYIEQKEGRQLTDAQREDLRGVIEKKLRAKEEKDSSHQGS